MECVENSVRVSHFGWNQAAELVMGLRRRGYSHFGLPDRDLWDCYDRDDKCMHLVAFDSSDSPIGCSRMFPGSIGELPIRLITRLEGVSWIQGLRISEAARFSVPNGPLAIEAKFALWRYGFRMAHSCGLDLIVLSTRASAAWMYRMLLFEEFGEDGAFRHEKRAGKPHVSLYLDLRTARSRFMERPELYEYFFGYGPLPQLKRK